MNCPICEFRTPNTNKVCVRCSYNFKKKDFTDINKLFIYYHKLKNERKWKQEVRLKWKLKEVKGQSIDWLADFLKSKGFQGASKSNLSYDIGLAKLLDKYPQLLECKTKSEARKRLEALLQGHNTKFISEENLQKYFFENWETTSLNKEWSLIKTGTTDTGKYRAGNIGEIDLLARHRERNQWLVIELKADKSSDKTIGQIQRYMAWVKSKLAKETEDVQGLIISGATNDKTLYSLKEAPNVELKIYQFDGDELKLRNPNEFISIDQLKKLGIDPKILNHIIKKIDDSG